MIVFLDTNVILDVLMKRDSFYKSSLKTIDYLLDNKIPTYISASAITDIYYIIRKATSSNDLAKKHVDSLTKVFNVASVNGVDIRNTLYNDVSDYEDAVLCEVADRYNAKYIITRNVKDFANSNVSVVEPIEWFNII